MRTTEVDRKTYVATCRLCGARLLYNREEDKLEKKGGDPDCPCELEIGEDEEDERLQEYGEEGEKDESN